MLKRRIDKILSEGHGRQLLWLFALTIVCIAIAVTIGCLCFEDKTFVWQDVVGLFLDPGTFGSFPSKGHDVFRLILALLSIFLLSALLVSVFTNVFENISNSVRNGDRRYKLKNHILILGADHNLAGILKDYEDSANSVVVMSESRPKVRGNYIYYHGARDDIDQLKSACVSRADTIYIIGEDDEDGHDARNLQALEHLKELCDNANHEIHCYLTVSEHTTTEVFQYLDVVQSGKLLLVDVINEFEFDVEHLLSYKNKDFLPVIQEHDTQRLDVVILGMGNVAKAVAYTIAHLSHYPNYATNGCKTRITFIDKGMQEKMDEFISIRPALFELSEYQYVSHEGTIESHKPKIENDFLDIEWRFVDTYPSSSIATKMLKDVSTDKNSIMRLFVCYEDSKYAISTLLRLPAEVLGRSKAEDEKNKIALYLGDNPSVINIANETEMYGNITVFGGENQLSSLAERSKHGQKVNFVYNLKYNNPPSGDKETAWYQSCEADKFSSIYCAIGMVQHDKCFNKDGKCKLIFETEHRRWMMAVLLMGYVPGEKKDKKLFIHHNIVPFDKLTPEEQAKDEVLINNMGYILGNGDDIPNV